MFVHFILHYRFYYIRGLVVINSDHPEEIAREEAIKEEGDEYTAKLDDPDYKDVAKKAEDPGDKITKICLKV